MQILDQSNRSVDEDGYSFLGGIGEVKSASYYQSREPSGLSHKDNGNMLLLEYQHSGLESKRSHECDVETVGTFRPRQYDLNDTEQTLEKAHHYSIGYSDNYQHLSIQENRESIGSECADLLN